jgi:hypothetical protein
MLVTCTTKKGQNSQNSQNGQNGQLWYKKKNPGGDEIFRTGPDRFWGSPSLMYCTMGIGSFPEVGNGRGVTLSPYPLLVLRSKTE